MIDLVQELGRLGVLEKEVNLNKVKGFDFTIEDQQVSVEPTNVDDITNVTISGSGRAIVDGKSVPLGDLLVKEAFNGERPDMDSDETSDFKTTFTSVKRDGRWYVSLFYTAAENARGDRDIPKKGVTPIGAKSPELTVDNLLQAVSDLRLEDAVAGLNPNEAEALQRYAPLFIDEAQQQIDEASLVWKISDTEYKVTGGGQKRHVAITALTFKADFEGQQFELKAKDGCVDVNIDGEEIHACASDAFDTGALTDLFDQIGLADDGSFQKYLEDLQEAFQDMTLDGITVNNVGGKWYVSPIGTFFDVIVAELRALDRGELETLIADVRALADSFQTQFEESFDPAFDPAFDPNAPSTYWTDCLYNDDPQGCIQTGVADGTFAADEIAAPYLYPQCGLFDYYAGDEVYNDTAAGFYDKITGAAKCITDAAEADGVDISFNSSEFVHPECFEKLNPYNYTDETVTDEARSDAWTCSYG
jgi:hypothetical protein